MRSVGLWCHMIESHSINETIGVIKSINDVVFLLLPYSGVSEHDMKDGLVMEQRHSLGC